MICSPHISALIPSSIILQNPENKKEIICDEALSRVFGGESKVTMFSMHKVRIYMSVLVNLCSDWTSTSHIHIPITFLLVHFASSIGKVRQECIRP